MLQQLLPREGLWPLSSWTKSPPTASTVTKVPFCTLPPAPMSRNPPDPHGLRRIRRHRAASLASGGASRRLSLICSRFAWEMTSLTSGSPRLGKRCRASHTASGSETLLRFVDPKPRQECQKNDENEGEFPVQASDDRMTECQDDRPPSKRPPVARACVARSRFSQILWIFACFANGAVRSAWSIQSISIQSIKTGRRGGGAWSATGQGGCHSVILSFCHVLIKKGKK